MNNINETIGCVNHDCDKCKAVQEPVAKDWEGAEYWMPLAWELCADECGEEACTELIWEGGPIPEPWGDRWLKYEDEAKRLIALVQKHTTPPAPQPVPVKTYHDGKPWPVAPMPWVGLSEDEINKLRHLVDWTAEWSYGRFAYELERLLREKNAAAHPATEESSAAQRTPAPNMTHASDEWALTNQILRGDA
jgi:hypothetical protein